MVEVVVPLTPTAFTDRLPLNAWTMYCVTGAPALAVEALHETVAWLTPADALTTGAVGRALPLRLKWSAT